MRGETEHTKLEIGKSRVVPTLLHSVTPELHPRGFGDVQDTLLGREGEDSGCLKDAGGKGSFLLQLYTENLLYMHPKKSV